MTYNSKYDVLVPPQKYGEYAIHLRHKGCKILKELEEYNRAIQEGMDFDIFRHAQILNYLEPSQAKKDHDMRKCKGRYDCLWCESND